MTAAMIEKLKVTPTDNSEAIFSLFTFAGQIVSGWITALGDSITLTAGTKGEVVPIEWIEAISFRKQ
jgi:hypothetical protein